MVKKGLKGIGLFILLILIVLAGYIVFMTITDYRPKEIINLNIDNNKEENLKKEVTYKVTTFNIGYCGMDDGQDFFMDGGKGSRSSSKEKTMDNLKSISKILKDKDGDFILLQEVDIDSTRSYHIDQYNYLKDALPLYGGIFAYNYKVKWVPLPILKPMGSVKSGLVTLSKYKVDKSNRYQYPGEEKWPVQLAELDRCFIESRIKVDNDRELVLVNSHLSAFDKGGIIRKQQLEYLKKYVEREYKKGNYIIVGGDYNHSIPGTDPSLFKASEKWPNWLQKLPMDFLPKDFKWAVDKYVPTNRTVAIPYKEDINFLSVIDGFLVSPNVEVKKVKGDSLNFQYSDHNPVTLEFMLK